MSAVRRLGVGVGAALLVMLPVAPASAAEQQQHANAYAQWNLAASGGIWNIDQNIQIRETARSTYWAGQWQWTNPSGGGYFSGGYFGVQENGVRFDGTTGSTAIFSIWDATDTRGPGCGTFGNEGTGLSCRLAYPIQTDRMYRLRLWRLEADGSGQWWGAWIRDQTTGVEHSIGQIRAPLNATAASNYLNFTEYFGLAVPAIDRVPRSIADYTQPAANQQAPGVYEAVGSFSGSAVGTGTVGTVEPISLGWTNAARIIMGGLSTLPARPNKVLASLTSARVHRAKGGRRVLRIVTKLGETVSISVKLRRGSKTLAKRTRREVFKGRRVIKLRLARSAPAGTARLRVTFTDKAAKKKTVKRKLKVPARRHG